MLNQIKKNNPIFDELNCQILFYDVFGMNPTLWNSLICDERFQAITQNDAHRVPPLILAS